MIRKILSSRFAPLAIPLAAVIFLAYQVHHSNRHKRLDVQLRPPLAQAVAAVPAKIPEEIQAGATSPRQTLDVFITLLANSSKEAQPRARRAQTDGKRVLPAIAESAKPKAMTMLSISCFEENEMETAKTLSISCRTDGYLSNAAGGDHILVKGVVTEDVVSAGKILIPAGSKVAGIGHVDSDSGRLESKGNWSIFAANHELRVQAEMKDADAGFSGIAGKETSFESQLSQRQAVVRDGRYCFLGDKTPFVLSLKGEISIKEIKTLESPE